DGTVEVWRKDLATATASIAGDDVLRVLANPAIPQGDRSEVVTKIVGDRIATPTRSLVLLLLQRGKIERLADVEREFRRLDDRRQGITAATVTSAAPLDADETKALTARLTQMTGGRVDLTFAVDPAILGGVVVRLGDRLIDGSVLGRLERLRSRLEAGAI
ncbi:MAG: ATP synthase F1 subunit delta, partial [Solirubrobacteraceae bacterium]